MTRRLRDIVRICWYVVLALWTIVRCLAAFPFLMLYMGAEIAGDDERARRYDDRIERISGV